MLPIEHLLPLHAVNITLEFTAPAKTRLFHHLALTAWLRHLIGDVQNYEHYITLDAPENGHVTYQKGDLYRFTLFALNGGEELLQHILNCLYKLPNNVKIRDKKMPFRDNLLFHQAQDLFTQEPIKSVAELSPYSFDTLQQETDIWFGHDQCWVSWLSPVRLTLPMQVKNKKKRERRFCRHHSQIDFALFNDRIYDALAGLLRQRVDNVPSRTTDETQRLEMADVFWIDYSYYNDKGYEKPMGGLLGRMVFDTEDMSREQWLYWVLGQYVGIGQRRSFGWGRYILESAQAGRTLPRVGAMSSLLELACRPDNLERALKELSGFGNLTGLDDGGRLIHLREQLLSGEYKIPCLRKRDGNLLDRVAQQAVTYVVGFALNTLVYSGSFGARRGKSEGDLDFDDVEWSRLFTRLNAFFGDDVVVDLVMGWMSATLDGEERLAGLPQGSPLSPVLASIMLDDFQSLKKS
ncbi:hypothetical protein QUF74_06825 [Candidatus Halobeggiatoa sp. HSG11]|nr:hypothetical protein [Candidatus Halobeggiatoa sp. HSG11]